jgi:hypothetical protein
MHSNVLSSKGAVTTHTTNIVLYIIDGEYGIDVKISLVGILIVFKRFSSLGCGLKHPIGSNKTSGKDLMIICVDRYAISFISSVSFVEMISEKKKSWILFSIQLIFFELRLTLI